MLGAMKEAYKEPYPYNYLSSTKGSLHSSHPCSSGGTCWCRACCHVSNLQGWEKPTLCGWWLLHTADGRSRSRGAEDVFKAKFAGNSHSPSAECSPGQGESPVLVLCSSPRLPGCLMVHSPGWNQAGSKPWRENQQFLHRADYARVRVVWWDGWFGEEAW